MIKIEPDGKRSSPHAPGADLDYSVNWMPWLDSGETIATSDWTASTGITLSRAAVVGSTMASVFAAGGVAGQSYVLTNTITTSAGRTDSRTITLRCAVR